MPRKGITGHDDWVITEALATALVALEQLEPTQQSRQQIEDIRKLLAANCQPGTLNLHLAQAKCRLTVGCQQFRVSSICWRDCWVGSSCSSATSAVASASVTTHSSWPVIPFFGMATRILCQGNGSKFRPAS